MPDTRLTVYLGRDNAEDLVLLDDGAVVDVSSITRLLLAVGEIAFDSDLVPAVFEWPVTLTYQAQSVNGLRIKLGGQGLAKRNYGQCRLTVFDPGYPNGLVWTENLQVQVR